MGPFAQLFFLLKSASLLGFARFQPRRGLDRSAVAEISAAQASRLWGHVRGLHLEQALSWLSFPVEIHLSLLKGRCSWSMLISRRRHCHDSPDQIL
jgi:hypothetical protein